MNFVVYFLAFIRRKSSQQNYKLIKKQEVNDLNSPKEE